MYKEFNVEPILFKIVNDTYRNNKDGEIETYLRYFNSLFYDDNYFQFISFKDELRVFNKNIETSGKVSSKESLLFAIVSFFLEDFNKSKAYLKNVESKDPKIKAIVSIMQSFFINKKDTFKHENISIIYSNNFFQPVDLIQNYHIQISLQKLLKIKHLSIYNSQDFAELTICLKSLKFSDYAFFIGHSDGVDGFVFNNSYDGKIKEIVDSNKLKKINHIKLLGLLNCNLKPYDTLIKEFEYLIIPDTSTKEYSEMFLYGFSIGVKHECNLDLCLKLGILGIMLRTNKEIPYCIYKNGSSFEWDENK